MLKQIRAEYKKERAAESDSVAPMSPDLKRGVAAFIAGTVATFNVFLPLKGIPDIYHASAVGLSLSANLYGLKHLLRSPEYTETCEMDVRIFLAKTAINASIVGDFARGQVERGAQQTAHGAQYAQGRVRAIGGALAHQF